MKSFSTTLALTFFSISLFGQSLQISDAPNTDSFISADLNGNAVQVKEPNGMVINTGKYDAIADDPSFKIYSLQNGAYIVRENIANFVLFDSFGSVIRPISNSTQSKDGEKISELATDPMGKTIVLYNPEVRNGSKKGSRAQVIGLENTERNIFYSDDQQIRSVRVSESGEFIAIASGKEGNDDEITVMDRYGNEIRTISFDQEVRGMNLYGSGSTLTVFSSGRVAVYNVQSGERIGSSSFRGGTLQFANYSGSDQTIVGLMGDLNGSTLSNIEVSIINVSARKIASQKYSGILQVDDVNGIILNRTGKFSYNLSGMSKDLRLRANF